MSGGKNFAVAVIGVAILASLSVRFAESAAKAPEWRLVWADEFDSDGPPNPANWTFERGLVRNHEAQFYQPDNATCREGHLVIEARRAVITQAQNAEYTSASLMTKGLHQWQYGRFVLRARIDTRQGLWPAWWTLGSAGEWPDGGEVDMLEYYRGMLLANVGWASGTRWVAHWDSVRTPLADLGPHWADGFHIWRMEWDADRIRLYVDDRLLNETLLAGTIDSARHTDPFHQPHYMLLNLAVGGDNGGDPVLTTFPARFEVDYVRVYQRGSAE
jgi:beta-glucanase (GH16 family)